MSCVTATGTRASDVLSNESWLLAPDADLVAVLCENEGASGDVDENTGEQET